VPGLQAGSSRGGAVVLVGVVGSASALPVCGAEVVVLGVVALGTVAPPRLTGGVGAGAAVTVGAGAVVVDGVVVVVVVSGTVVAAVDVVRGGSRGLSSSPPPHAAKPPPAATSTRVQAILEMG